MSKIPLRAKITHHGLTLGPFHFKAGLIPTIATAVLVCFLVNLGFWQLRRADFKNEVIQRHELRSKMPEIKLTTLDFANPEKLADLPVLVTGRYLNKQHLMLDNRTHNGQPGYEVLSPFLVEQQILLVNRGWRPQGRTRQDLPGVPDISGEITLHGIIHIPNPDFFVLMEDDYQSVSWPMVIQKIDLEKTASLFDHPVLPIVLRLRPEPNSDWIRQWHNTLMGPEKHYGYAVQWFALAFALIVIYFVVNTKKTITTPRP